MVFEVLEPNFHKLRLRLQSGVRTIDDVMQAHTEFLDECLKECLLTDQNLFRILTRLNQNSNFFARIIQRLFNQINTSETLDRAVTENEWYGKHSTFFKDANEAEEKGVD